MRLIVAVTLAVAIAARVDAISQGRSKSEVRSILASGSADVVTAEESHRCPTFSQSLPSQSFCDNEPVAAFKRSLIESFDADSTIIRRSEVEDEEEGIYIAAPSWQEYAHNPSLGDWTSFSETVPVPPPGQNPSSSQPQPKGGRRKRLGLLDRALSSSSRKVNVEADDAMIGGRKTTPLVGNYVVNHEAPYPNYGRQPQTLTGAASNAAMDMQTGYDSSSMSDVDKLLEAQRAFTAEDSQSWLQEQIEPMREEDIDIEATEERKRRSRMRALKIDDSGGKAERMEVIKESPLSSHDSTTIIMNPPEISRFEEDIFYSTPETDIHRGSSSKLTSTMRKPRSKEKYKPRKVSLAELERRRRKEEERRLRKGEESSSSGRFIPGRAKIYNAFQKTSSSVSRAERNKIKAEIMKGVVGGISGIRDRFAKAVSQYTSSASDSDTASTPGVERHEESVKGGSFGPPFDKRSTQMQHDTALARGYSLTDQYDSLWRSDDAPQTALMSRYEEEGMTTNDDLLMSSGDPFGELENYPGTSQFLDKMTQCCCPPRTSADDDLFPNQAGNLEHQAMLPSASQISGQHRLVKRSPIPPVIPHDAKISVESVDLDKRGFTEYPLELAAYAEQSGRGQMAEKYLLHKDLAKGKVSRAWRRYLAQPALTVPETRVVMPKGPPGNDFGGGFGTQGGKNHAEVIRDDHKAEEELARLNLPEVKKKAALHQMSQDALFTRLDNLHLSLNDRNEQLLQGADPTLIEQRKAIREAIQKEENDLLVTRHAELQRELEEAEAIAKLAEAPNASKKSNDAGGTEHDGSGSSQTLHSPTHRDDQADTRDHEARWKEAEGWVQKYLTRHELWPPGHGADGVENVITPQMEADLAKEIQKLEGLHADPSSTLRSKRVDLKEAEKHFRQYLKKNHIMPPKPILAKDNAHDETEQQNHEHLANQYGLSLDILNKGRQQGPPTIQPPGHTVQQSPQDQHQDKLFDVLDEYNRKDQPK